MLISIFLLICGGGLLYCGANWMVRGGSNLAGRLGVTPLVIGLTVVAFGTSLPELMVSLVAALNEKESIALGNIIGSNIANVGLVLGLSSMIFPITVSYKAISRELRIYFVVAIVFILFCANGIIARWEGIILFAGVIAFTWMHLKHPPADLEQLNRESESIPKSLILLVFGVGFLTWGADLFVTGAVELATLLGIPEVVIGMTVVALGTSLPELATSVVAAFHKESGISIGNIIGSNIFNILSVIGLVSVIRPMSVEPGILTLELPIMLAFGVILFPIAKMKQPIPRLSAIILFSSYIIIMIWLFNQ
ncbi:MAG: calcium/sodium antiporter [Candidatus Marinimicrobia bacterium]|nr:calcium/sodium antiporter [Candidatus Neomarinimicrobiota bacterium]